MQPKKTTAHGLEALQELHRHWRPPRAQPGHPLPEGDRPIDDHPPRFHVRHLAEEDLQLVGERRVPEVPEVAHLLAVGLPGE